MNNYYLVGKELNMLKIYCVDILSTMRLIICDRELKPRMLVLAKACCTFHMADAVCCFHIMPVHFRGYVFRLFIRPDSWALKLFPCSNQRTMKYILLINVKIPLFSDILTFTMIWQVKLYTPAASFKSLI